jgi:hypothetical protein
MNAEDALYRVKYLALIDDIRKEFPRFAIVHKKKSAFSQLLGSIARWNKEFNARYTTTIGPKIYVNYGWDKRSWKNRYDVLVHERIHMRQFQKWGFLTFNILYFLVPFPIKLSYFRKKFEADAYEVGIYIDLKEKGREYVLGPKFRKYLLDQFCGPFYGWTWYSERAILKWLLRTVRAIEKGTLTWKMLWHRDRLPSTARPLDVPKLLKWLYPQEFAV